MIKTIRKSALRADLDDLRSQMIDLDKTQNPALKR